MLPRSISSLAVDFWLFLMKNVTETTTDVVAAALTPALNNLLINFVRVERDCLI